MSGQTEFVNILDIPLWASDIPAAGDLLMKVVATDPGRNYCVSATGAHGLVYSYKNPSFKSILRSFFMNLPDGMPGVWVGRMKKARKMKRCYGPDFFKHLVSISSGTSVKHFLCGGNPGVAEELRDVLAKSFHNNNVVGVYCPPFLPVDKYDYATIAQQINDSKADVVWIGLSTPKQETFAYNLSKFTNVSFLIAVGAAFDFHTGNVRQAPTFLQRIGLEWAFRMTMEPKRLFRRYAEIVPLFIYFNIRELIKKNKHVSS